jgi:succinylarginine dihydrolase
MIHPGHAVEVNFDGLIGPSHNYGGLSYGNLASQTHAESVSHPREAALQGLEKMRTLVGAGLVQGVLPPLPRPNWDFFAAIGHGGSRADTLAKLAAESPRLMRAGWSASAMWTANAATVSPSADTGDGRVHLSVANLATMLHRSLEAPDTLASLRAIFRDPARFGVHPALPAHADFHDEGAANHMRLCASHGAAGVEVFVHGREAGEMSSGFPARQTRLASEAIARRHGLDPARTVHVRQSAEAIAAGAFHNDVVAVACLDTLFYHENAFDDADAMQDAVTRAAQGLFTPRFVCVPQAEVSLPDAIASYLFNSQLLQEPGADRLTLIAPTEARDRPATRTYCERLTAGNGPIGAVRFVDVRQSMRNGGGPACLRLRVVLTPEELAAVHPGVILTQARIDALQEVVRMHWPETVAPEDLANPAFATRCETARKAALDVLGLTL